jgi:hypothetical protein
MPSLLEAYGLIQEDDGETALVRARAPRDGEHKLQALTLFFAALEITRRDANARLALFEVSPLHRAIADGARRDGREAAGDIFHRAAGLLDSGSPLTLDDASAAYLRQASFDLGQTRLSHEDLAGLHRLLTAPATVRRKAA